MLPIAQQGPVEVEEEFAIEQNNGDKEAAPGDAPAVVAPAVVAPGDVLEEDVAGNILREDMPSIVPAGPAVENVIERQGFNVISPMRYDDIMLDVQNATGEPNRPDAHVAGITRTRRANVWADYVLASIQRRFNY
ncbi:hypothetical protein FBU31_006166 [Coemansia sp. 'formosensis']|nr:hypothetical protein FBU31_006166 [Coemansia sp. 'formosensis']